MNHRSCFMILTGLLLVFTCRTGWAQQTNAPGQTSQAAVAEYEKPFLVFDAIGLKNKPDLAPYGFKPITVLYHTQMWPKGVSDAQPNERRLRLLAQQAWRRGHLVCVDIEHWPLYQQPAEVRQASINKLARVADVIHETAPGLRLGFYRLLPRREYWAVVGKDQSLREAWEKHNEQMRELADRVDVVFPSLYTFYEDPSGWVKYAEANIAQARRYGKQVYVFLWPWYHSSNKEKTGQMVPADYWRLQLDTCRRLADGVVIWTDPYKPWNPNAPWWKQTRQFMDELQAKPADKEQRHLSE